MFGTSQRPLSEDYYRRDADMDDIRSSQHERDRFREIPPEDLKPAEAEPDELFPETPPVNNQPESHHG